MNNLTSSDRRGILGFAVLLAVGLVLGLWILGAEIKATRHKHAHEDGAGCNISRLLSRTLKIPVAYGFAKRFGSMVMLG